MRRSSAPSKKPGLGVSCNSVPHHTTVDQVPIFPKAARSTASILSLLNSDDEGNTDYKEDNVSNLHSPEVHHISVVKENVKTIPVEHTEDREPLASYQENDSICENTTNFIKVFNVVWGKQSTKKHKTWEGDGTLHVSGKSVVLKDTEGKILGTTSRIISPLEEGSRILVGSKEVEIIDVVTTSQPLPMKLENKQKSNVPQTSIKTARPAKRGILSHSFAPPIKRKTGPGILEHHAPLLMPQPPNEHQWKYNAASLPVTDVAVDPFLVRILRPHQREGVVFLYECIMGMHKMEFQGAILADEMGLGKTLQCITLVWTLLKKGPYGGVPVLKYVVIVTPSSLVSNWEKEFLSWLGRERINIFVVDQKNKPRDYGKTRREPIMLISYEMFVRYYEDIIALRFDLLICDEAHRLKNSSIKVSMLLTQLTCKRKILLTGTPIQNDLQEFFALIDFVNPGVLGTLQDFHQHFEEPIVASRQPNIRMDIRELGENRAKELKNATKWFILRRTQEVIHKFLPTKEESVIFCIMSDLQIQLYKTAVSFWTNRDEIPNADKMAHLSVITALKKICNHPSLIMDKAESISDYIEQVCGDEYSFSIQDSGKLCVVMNLLQELSSTKEKIVIISYYTQTLDMFAEICNQHGYKFSRLDGSVASGQRQKIVDNFNNSYTNNFVFLLSARAGGVGLNLTGASRLVLYDCDWNPATDLQAMSRIWRDGQKRAVYIYRLLTVGSIEEKMFQRQLSKTGLSGAIVDPQNKTSIKLSNDELKDLLSLQENITCLTHDLLKCECSNSGEIPEPPPSSATEPTKEESSEDLCPLIQESKLESQKLHMNELFKWEHHGQPFNSEVLKVMGLASSSDFITYMFRNISRD